MRKSLLLCVLASAVLSSCGFKEKIVWQDFYSKTIAINDSLDKLTTQWHTLRDQASISKNYSSLAPARIELGSFIARARSTFANLPSTPQTEKMKNDEDMLLLNQSNMVAEVYPTFEQFNEYTPKEVVDKSLGQITNDLIDEKAKVSAINRALEGFAKIHDLKK